MEEKIIEIIKTIPQEQQEKLYLIIKAIIEEWQRD